jgi:alkaline phosphatase
VHTSAREAGTGIVDQYLDDRELIGLAILMGGARKWVVLATTPGCARDDKTDYASYATDAHTADIAKRRGASAGQLDKDRNLLEEFQSAGSQIRC